MAVSRVKTSSILQGFPKSRSLLAGNAAFNPSSFESIATTTVGSGGSSTITFSSIPATYTHLQIRGIGRSDAASGNSWIYLRFNGDSGTNYASHYLRGNGTAASASALTGAGNNTEQRLGDFPRADATSGIFGVGVIDILDYTNTNKYKTTRFLGGADKNGSGVVSLYSSVWLSTSAVTSITLTPQTDNWVQYSSFALYGIK